MSPDDLFRHQRGAVIASAGKFMGSLTLGVWGKAFLLKSHHASPWNDLNLIHLMETHGDF